MIELKDVSFTYESGETQNNLNHINLTIQDGETILLCGESGCGKTTLTRLVNGLIPHYYGGKLTGQVLLDGKELKDYPLYQIGQRVGSVFQNPRTQFYNVDTTSQIVFGCENMALPVPEMQERLEETTHSLKLEKTVESGLVCPVRRGKSKKSPVPLPTQSTRTSLYWTSHPPTWILPLSKI